MISNYSMLDGIKQDQRDLMILKISNKAKSLQEELRKYQLLLQRLNLLSQETPKDQFGDDIPQTDIDKHYTKAKAEFDKIFPKTTQ